jgi:predicted ATP-dependent endonuclease of OLD family
MQKAHKIKIHNFRAITDIEYNPSMINLIVGPNNSGKTAILDAISIFYTKNLHYSSVSDDLFKNEPNFNIRLNSDYSCISIDDKDVFLFSNLENLENFFPEYLDEIRSEIINDLINNYRKQGYPEEYANEYLQNIFENFNFFIIKWNNEFVSEPYFKKKDDKRELFREFLNKLNFEKTTDKIIRYIKAEYDLNPHSLAKNKFEPDFPIIQVNHKNKRFLGRISEEDLYLLEKFIQENDLLSGFERLSRDEVIYRKDDGVVSLPLQAHGDGFIAMIVTISYILKAKNGILLIEEPENHLHPRYIQIFTEMIIRYCKKMNAQVFMATHSQDLIEQFISCSKTASETDLVSILRIARDDYDMIPIFFNTEKASHVINDLLLDIRGV